MIKRLLLLLLSISLNYFVSLDSICTNNVPGSPFLAPNPISVEFAQSFLTDKLFAGVVQDIVDQVTLFSVNKQTGQFTQVDIGSGNNIYRNIAFTNELSTGKIFVAVPNGTFPGGVTVFELDTTAETLTLVLPSPTPVTGNEANAVAFTPELSTGMVYAGVTAGSSSILDIFQVDKITGQFILVASSGTCTNPLSIAISQELTSGNVFAAVSCNDDTISVFSIDKNTGALTLVSGFPFPIAPGVTPQTVAFSPQLPNGKLYLATANVTTNNIGIFEVDINSGILTQVPGSPFTVAPSGTFPFGIAFTNLLPPTPGELFLISSNNGSDNATIFSVNQTSGSLTKVTDFAVGIGPQGVAITKGPLTENVFVAVVNEVANNVSVILLSLAPPVISSVNTSTDCSGSLTIVGTAEPNNLVTLFIDGINIGNTVADPSGNFTFTVIPNPPLSAGTHSVAGTQTNSQACVSPQSNPTQFIVENCEIVISSPPTNSTTTDTTPTFSGTAPANSIIVIFDTFPSNSIMLTKEIEKSFATNAIGQVTSDSAGNFSFTPTTPLALGTHTIFAELAVNPTVTSNRVVITIASSGVLGDSLTRAIFNKYGCRL